MEITPKTPWKEKRIKAGTILDRKLSADILKIRRAHDSNIKEIEKKTEYSAFMLAVCLLGALLLMVVFCRVSHAEDINLDIIADIESSSEPLAYNNGHVGMYQISQGVLTTRNAVIDNCGTDCMGIRKYTLENMYNPSNAREVADWYINTKIKEYFLEYNIPDTITSRIIAWNWGIGHLKKWFKQGSHWNKLPLETRHYIQKYFKELKGDD